MEYFHLALEILVPVTAGFLFLYFGLLQQLYSNRRKYERKLQERMVEMTELEIKTSIQMQEVAAATREHLPTLDQKKLNFHGNEVIQVHTDRIDIDTGKIQKKVVDGLDYTDYKKAQKKHESELIADIQQIIDRQIALPVHEEIAPQYLSTRDMAGIDRRNEIISARQRLDLRYAEPPKDGYIFQKGLRWKTVEEVEAEEQTDG